MADDGTNAKLLAELQALRRRVSDMEADMAAHMRHEAKLVQDAAVSEAALRQSMATGEALLESASEGIVLIDVAGRITLVNAAAERMFGYSRAELLGERLEILLPERIRGGHVAHRTGYFAGPRVRPMGIGLDLSGRRKDGGEFPVEISLSYVELPAGRLAMAFVTDITERKRAEAQLQRQRETLYQAEKMAALGTLSAGIAHEMNNPLGIITSRIEVMLLEAEGQHLPPQVVEDLQVLHRASQRVARIAAGLRSFARQSPGERGPVSLNAVVEETVLLMQKPLATDNIRVSCTLDGALPPIEGDASALHQILMNLVTNAREAMAGHGGEIEVQTARAPGGEGRVRLVVADSGPGIPAEELSKIFDPFFTTKSSGTGLGLSVSYGIIQDHGGTVDVTSEPGRGTRFTLSFPVSPAAA
jgi:PAS domain S-box-containing protein